LLCPGCNTIAGFCEKKHEVVHAALNYIESHRISI
jgi:hypothetical protein